MHKKNTHFLNEEHYKKTKKKQPHFKSGFWVILTPPERHY